MEERGPGYDYLFKVILIGDAACGKSSLLMKYCDNIFPENYECTIGVDFKMKTIQRNDKYAKLQIWDTAGQERYKPMTSSYYKGSHGCVIVYDITKRESFESVPQWIEQYKNTANLKGGKIILVGNKCDLDSKRDVESEEQNRISTMYDVEHLECSAKTG